MVVGRIPLKCGGLSRHDDDDDDDDDVCFVVVLMFRVVSLGAEGEQHRPTSLWTDASHTSTEIPKIHIRNFETSL
jgi:hypothetical protein